MQLLKRDFAICCGSLYDADLIGGEIVLSCITCGSRWERQADGSFARMGQASAPQHDRNGRPKPSQPAAAGEDR